MRQVQQASVGCSTNVVVDASVPAISAAHVTARGPTRPKLSPGPATAAQPSDGRRSPVPLVHQRTRSRNNPSSAGPGNS